MPIPRAGRVLALDWGEVRSGLALSDETQLLATPLTTLVRRRGKRFPIRALLELCRDHEVAGLVVGLPLTPEGEEGPAAGAARDLAQALARRTDLPLELRDERLTTRQALGAVRALGGRARGPGRREQVDALAATVLLQGWLESRRAGRTDAPA